MPWSTFLSCSLIHLPFQAFVWQDFYDKNRMAVLDEKFVFISGVIQNQGDIVHLKAQKNRPLSVSAAEVQSRDFH